MKLVNSNICLTSRKSIMVMLSLFFSTLVLASVWPEEETVIIEEKEVEVWEPTEEDIAFQDSMYSIIERTQLDLDTIRAGIDRILYKLEKFEYPDGTYDSIRYVVGSRIDKRRNKN
jgi:hypothetical protein|tara:strand:+ start:156 stop:503 length:348 start_codon:yes stop_codon:yes gene_type:complete